MPDYIVFMLRLQSGPETSPCPHPSNTMCMIRVQQRPPMEEKNATAEFWVRFPNKECIRTMHLLQAPRLRVAVQLLFRFCSWSKKIKGCHPAMCILQALGLRVAVQMLFRFAFAKRDVKSLLASHLVGSPRCRPCHPCRP